MNRISTPLRVIMGAIMKLIPLTHGLFAKVDDAQFAELMQWKWRAHFAKNTGTYYAERTRRKSDGPGSENIKMATVIFGAPRPDHKNGDTLDNQILNLRAATPGQNSWNRRMRSDNATGFIGVHLHKSTGKYRARIKVVGKKVPVSLGLYRTPEEAAKAWDVAAQRHHGEFARLNQVSA